MATYAYPTDTIQLNTAEIATLKDALMEEDIPQAYRNALLCQMFMGKAREPGLNIQGQDLMLPGGVRPKRRTKGGTRATCPVNFEIGTTAQFFTGGDVLDTSQADGPTETWVDWAFLTCYVSIFGTDRLKNTGPGKRLDILRSRQNQEIRQMTRTAETAMWSANTDTVEGTQNAFPGLQHKVATAPTSGTKQGLDQSVFTPWRNVYDATVGSFAAGGLDAFESFWYDLAGTNGMEPPHLFATESTVAGYVTKALRGVHRIVGSLNGNDLSASRLPTIMGVPIVHTDDCTSGYAYGFNFDYMENLILEGADWVSEIPGQPNDQFLQGQHRWILGAAPMMFTRLEKQGVLAGITA